MLSQPARIDRRSTLLTLLSCLSVLTLALGCDKVPLLAPSGSVITIFPVSTTVPVNGQIEIVATVIEQGVAQTGTGGGTGGTTTGGTTTGGTTTGGTTTGGTTTATSTTGAGTPVQNGTLVTFTTTIGRIEPSEARTNNGQVRVRFIAGGQSGTATITAFSGGASGRIENLRVGSAAAERVLITATPQTVGPSGGASQIAARVEDTTGQGLPGVPVNFIADAGTLSVSTATTDQDGVARTQLTTSRVTIVTANVAGKTATVTVNLNPRTGIRIVGPTTPVSAGVPVTFTVSVGAAPANITNVVVDFGDETAQQQLGAISGETPLQHTYQEAGTYNVRATATEASGFSETVSTSVTILPGQPPGVTLSVTDREPGRFEEVIVTAQVTGATSAIVGYEWNFGSGASPAGTFRTTSNRQDVRWDTVGTKTIRVTVFQATGPSGDGVTTVNVQQ